MDQKIGVIGSGVSGLTCGIRLLDLGFDVEIFAREQSPYLVSDVAAAFWYPFRAEPKELVREWANIAYQEFGRLSAIPDSGVAKVPIRHLYSTEAPDPWWAGSVNGFRSLGSEDMFGDFREGFSYETFLLESPLYMPYLRARFAAGGGKILPREIQNLNEFVGQYPVLVNCCGAAAFHLLNDEEVYPIRGQILRIARPAGLPMSVIEVLGGSFVCRSRDCIVTGANTDHDWSLDLRESDTERLLKIYERLCPELGTPTVLEQKVGIRPGRSRVRLELEKLSSGLSIVHNYGHGGAGFTLSWGCAEEVARLVQSALPL